MKQEIETRQPKLDKNHKYAEHNSFVTAIYDRRLTALGQKLIRIAIAECDSKKDDKFYLYRIKIIDLIKMLDLSEGEKKNLYRDVKKAARYMATFAIAIDDGRRNGAYRFMPMFRRIEYLEYEGVLEIAFNDEMTPFFLHLKKNFSQVPLHAILDMDHKYSLRVYELINMQLYKSKKHKDDTFISPLGNRLPIDHNEVYVSIEEVRRVTETEKTFKDTKDLKRRVLEPAFRDIEKSAGYHIEIEDVKKGRKIVGFNLHIHTVSAWQVLQLQKDQVPGQITLFDEGLRA